jgi:hypothetical protein
VIVAEIFKDMNEGRKPENICFVNGLTGEITKEVPFEEVPQSIRFAPNSEGVVTAVVKIVELRTGDKRTIRQFGYNDVLLRTTVQYYQPQ